MRKRWFSLSLITASFILFLVACGFYTHFTSTMIYEESAHHLTEIYAQINRSFREMVSTNWQILRSWTSYFEDVHEEEKIASFIQEQQEQWGFTNFYFLSHDGHYQMIDGTSGYMDLKEQLPQLILQGENIVMDISLPGIPEQEVFAVPAPSGAFHGFTYDAIAISFNDRDLISALDVSAFDGQSSSFVVYVNGRVLLDNGREMSPIKYNFLAGMEMVSDLSPEELDDLRESFLKGESGSILFRIAKESYYLTYAPVGFEDLLVVGVVPARVVNANMDKLQRTTIFVIVGLALCVSVALILFLIRRNRESLAKKDTEILYRESLFETLSNNVDDIFLMLDAKDLHVLYVSPNVQKIIGFSADAVKADIQKMAEFIQMPDDEVSVLELLSQISPGEKREREREYINRKTGDRLWLHVLAYRTQIGGAERFVVVLSDRTRERTLNQALTNALDVAKSANAAKSNFLANMSHDIRTPMNAILGFSSLLAKNADRPNKVREYTREIQFSTQHLVGLLNDILDMSKIESGKTSLHLTEFTLANLMEELYSIVLPQSNVKHQTLTWHTRGQLPERVVGDKTRLCQILLNLLSNAIKYTPEDGVISLTLEGLEPNIHHHAHLRFVVADNGFGMSEAFQQEIFDPFARENTRRNQETQGTGLGMAITKNIVDLMGGTISVQSELGHGSTFTVELELQIVEDCVETFWQRHHIARLLVVDKDKSIYLDVKSLIEETGVHVSYVPAGSQVAEGIAAAKDQGKGFDLILLDGEICDREGEATIRRIRETAGKNIPIVMMSVPDDSAFKREWDEASGIFFLPKPFFLSHLQRIITQYEEIQSGTGETNPQEMPSLEGMHILVAEDNKTNAIITLELMNLEGATCELVPNGEKALERFSASKSGEFNIILMDVQMPVMDGYEATRRIRVSRHPDALIIPIIALTANAFEDDVQKALAAGMNAHMAKPVDPDYLKSVIFHLGKQKEN